MSQPATVTVDRDDQELHLSMRLAGVEPGQVVRAFTDPALLRRWWGGELEVDPRPGGPYVVRFEALGQTMRGEVVEHEPAGLLRFTWSWDHQPGIPAREVTVRAGAAGGDTLVQVEHGPFGDSPSERAEAGGHREGWQHFLPRLADCLA